MQLYSVLTLWTKEVNTVLGIKIDKVHVNNHPKILRVYFDHMLTLNQHTKNKDKIIKTQHQECQKLISCHAMPGAT